MSVLNISGYQFMRLPEDALSPLRQEWQALSIHLKGTILISEEGVNINLAGKPCDIEKFQSHLKQDPRFCHLVFKGTVSPEAPFKKLKIKIKKEIITFRQPVHPECGPAPSISPETFKQWMDDQRDITIVDTRNDFEVEYGTFEQAVKLHMKNFCEFPKAAEVLDPEKTTVLLCTGGIRCEKASLYLLKQGFKSVYQLEGGILNYFSKSGSAHFQGHCFVFDERVALRPDLQPYFKNHL